MKKSVLYKLIAGTILVSAITISTPGISAQRRSQQNEKLRYQERNKPNRVRVYDRNKKHNKSNYTFRPDRKKNQDSKKYKKQHSGTHSNYYAKYHSNHQRSVNAYPQKQKNNYHSAYVHKKPVRPHARYRYFYNHYGHHVYHHDRFGDVVVRFAVYPVVISHRYGDYYFSDGDYYRFYPEIGYVLADAPNSLYFSYVPDDCRRISYHGDEYYTNGNICFVKHRKGYRLVKAPTGIHLSVRFWNILMKSTTISNSM